MCVCVCVCVFARAYSASARAHPLLFLGRRASVLADAAPMSSRVVFGGAGGGTAQGIGRYAEGVIPGVHSDAAAVASSLRGAGWEVQEALDCSRHALLAAVTSLLSTLRAGRHAGRWCVPAPAPQDR
eukprot:COSAG01_NODE_841_length_13175_cov_26.426124_4_plen_127_part_00